LINIKNKLFQVAQSDNTITYFKKQN